MSTCGQSRKSKKLLYYFPIIHTPSDMGGLAQAVRRFSLQHTGPQGWQRKKRIVQQGWQEIGRAVKALGLNYSRARVYQDGLPICGKELDIVRDLARLGSPNHRLVLNLVEQGACLMGTESAELLVREYEVIKQGLDKSPQPGSDQRTGGTEKILDTFLAERDEFIAQRINHTLEPEDLGVVFLGMLHDLRPWLAADIEVLYPLGAPRSQKGPDHVG